MSLKRRTRQPLTEVSPYTRVSEHFILADFLGNQSVYTKGYKNSLVSDSASLKKMDNLTALCVHGLEPILRKWGPLTVSYGYISPEVSQKIVGYMDPNKPSHHRFDLGAAADICVHRWVSCGFLRLEDLFLPTSAVGSPIALAHAIDQEDIPYSRLITYSESPYLCLALSSEEVYRRQPRKAFYENRYQGRKGGKPEYIQLSNQGARDRHFTQLQELGLEHPWEGEGYPTYHGGGRRQYQHMRVSKYTMISDFLLDLQSIANGAPNVPALNQDSVLDSFAAAGMVYDRIIDGCEIRRASIVAGYVSHLNPYFDSSNDWRTDFIQFTIVPPGNADAMADYINGNFPDGVAAMAEGTNVVLSIAVDKVLGLADWTEQL
jgi:hypothetical protein